MATNEKDNSYNKPFINRLKLRGFKSFKNADLELPPGFIAVAGPNGSGKCVKGDTLVMTCKGKLIKIKDLVDKRLNEGKVKKLDDGFVTFENPEELEVFSINPKTLKVEKKRISAFVKRTSYDYLYKIITKSGKQITTTNDHPLITLEQGKIKALKVEELEKGSTVALPRKIAIESSKIPIFTELIKYNTNIYLYDPIPIKNLIDAERKKRGLSIKQIAEESGVPKLTVSGLLYGQSIRLHYAYKLLEYFGHPIESIYHYTKNVKGLTKKIKVPFYLNENIAYILGLIIAEGRLAQNEVFLSNNSEGIIKYFGKCMLEEFDCDINVRRYTNKTLTLVSSSPLIHIFNKVFGLGIGEHASKKKIPEKIFMANDGIAKSFLSGLYDGDGYISDPKIKKIQSEITFASKELSLGVMFLFNRFGIIGRYTESMKCATNTKNKTKRRYYRVSCYGLKNILKLTNYLDLHNELKSKRLETFSSGNQLVNLEDTNVDTIPSINGIIKQGLTENNYSDRKLKNVKPSKIRAYFENRCFPTRIGLSEATKLMSKRTPIKQYLDLLANSDIFWDSIKTIEKVKGEKWVYDLTIEDNHNFYANGLFVHNSNLSDSVRFALGELSLKSLRAKRTSELVFTDSKEAAVTLYAGNTDGNSLEVRRAINKEGKTIYKLNGKKTTRTNILEAIRPIGLELGDHNVIAQGQVQKIVEMSAKERRGILDGVAGISEFEDKKKESIKELDKVQQKINDASIVLSEREGFVTELEKEKDAALKYKESKELFKRGRASLVHKELDKYQEEYDNSIKKLKEINDKLQESQKDINILEKHIKELETKKNILTEKINKDGKKEGLLKQLEELRININVGKNSLVEKDKEIKRLETEKTKATKEQTVLSTKVSNLEKDILQIDTELKELQKEVPEEVFNASPDDHQLQEKLNKINEGLSSKKETLAKITANLESLEEMIKVRKESLDDEDVDLTTLENEKETLEEEISTLQKEVERIFKLEKEKNKLIAETDRDLINLRGKAAELRPHVKGLSKNPTLMYIDQIKSKLPGLYGTVAELVSFDQRYTDAVQGAVGGRLEYVVVEDVDTAAKIIALLKKQKVGRCTFIPLDRDARGESIPQKVKSSNGFEDSLMNVVKFDPKFYNAIEYAFGSTAVVDSIETAKKLKGTCKMVTLGGEVFYTSGILTGGASKGSLAAKMKLEKIESTIENLKTEKTQLYSDLENLREDMNRKRKERTALELKYREIMIEIGGITKSTEKIKMKSEDIRNALKDLENKKRELNTQNSKFTEEITLLESQRLDLNKRLEEHKEKQKEQQTAMQKKYSKILSKLSDKRADFQSKQKEKEMIEDSLKQLKNSEAQISTDLSQSIKEKKELKKELVSNEEEHDRIEEEMNKISKKMEGVWEEIKKLSKDLEDLSQQKGKLSYAYERAKDSLKDYEINKAKVETRLIDLKAEYEEYVNVTLIEASREKLLEIIRENEKVLNELGEVNLKAPELYEEKKQEIEEIKERVEKLKDERSAVLTMIDEIDSKKKKIFMETFHKINDKFKDLFGYVLDGEGLLVLDKPNDPFESGLQIRVKKGNKNKYLDSMSGGEKSLLALLFIFSIQMTKHSPFYLLDEAEAALDKENSKKMAELIKRLSKDTQFLVITHNDEVLKSADVALGVTMTDKGSQVLGIELNEYTK